MAVTVVLTNVIKEPAPSTRCRIRFSDGTELEFNSLADVLSWVQEVDSGQGGIAIAQRMCVAWAIARSPELTNLATVRDKNFTLDLSQAQPIRVQ